MMKIHVEKPRTRMANTRNDFYVSFSVAFGVSTRITTIHYKIHIKMGPLLLVLCATENAMMFVKCIYNGGGNA